MRYDQSSDQERGKGIRGKRKIAGARLLADGGIQATIHITKQDNSTKSITLGTFESDDMAEAARHAAEQAKANLAAERELPVGKLRWTDAAAGWQVPRTLLRPNP